MVKKILIGLGVVFALFVSAAILIPLFVDVNKFRPQIEKAVEDNLNADLDLGQLKLSLWGAVNVEVDKLILSEKGSQGKKPVFVMKNFSLVVPFSSVFSGRPNVTVTVAQPEVYVVNEADGKLNVLKMVKPASTTQPSQPAEKKSGGVSGLPFELSFNIKNGIVEYKDVRKNSKTTVQSLNLDMKNVTLNKPMKFTFSSLLDVKEIKNLILKGPVSVSGVLGAYMKSDGGLDRAEFEVDGDLSDLVIRYGDLFKKNDKVDLKFSTKGVATESNLKLEKAHVLAGDASVDMSGTVQNFSAPVLDLSIASSKFVFEHWKTVIGPLEDFDMKGSARFNVKAAGPLSHLNVQGRASADGISLKAPGIVPRVTDVNAQLDFSEDTARISKATMKLGASDLTLDGTLKSFSKPVINVVVKSQLMDVDSILPKKTPEQEKAEAAKAETQKGKAADIEKSVSGPIAAMKKNPTARAIDFTGKLQMKKIIVHKAEISNLDSEMTFKDLVMTLKKATAQAFGGRMNFSSSIDFRGVDPTYSASGDVAGLDVNAAMTSQMPSLKDTVFGKLISKFGINGSGLNKAKVTQSLKGKGDFKLEGGSWSALKVLQQIGEKLKSIPGAKDKVGGVQITGKFKQCRSDFTIAGGRFNILNMIADMEESRTTLTGQGFVDFDLNLSMNGKIATPAGGDLPSDIRAPDGRLSIPYELAGKANSPTFKADKTLQVVGQAYLKKEGGAAVKKALENVDNPVVKDLLKKLPF